MSLLLDTHALLWWLEGTNLPDAVAARISDPTEDVAFSAASVWEVSIKEMLGKLRVPEPLSVVAAEEGFRPLPVTFEHAERLLDLPPHHRDPFDRMLVAQAQVEGLTIVTHDRQFDRYDVPILSC